MVTGDGGSGSGSGCAGGGGGGGDGDGWTVVEGELHVSTLVKFYRH